jgi:hypothetical protein
MKFRPNAQLDPSQITDLSHNMGFYYWLMRQRQGNPFLQLQLRSLPWNNGHLPLPIGNNGASYALPQALVQRFGPQFMATRRR